MVGGTTSGYSLIGNRTMAINPTMKITMESTPAKIGRRMKKWEKFMALVGVDCSGVFKKLQAPNSNLQRSSNPQTPNRPLWGADIWDLEFGISLELGAWDLELFHSRPFVFA